MTAPPATPKRRASPTDTAPPGNQPAERPAHHALTHFQHVHSAGTSCGWCCSPDHLRKVRDRVRRVAWLIFITMSAGALIDFAYAGFVMNIWHPLWSVLAAIAILPSIGLILAANDDRVESMTVLRLGLGYEVVLCLVMATLMPWMEYLDLGDVPYVTWVTPLIIAFPLIIPSPPNVALVVAIAAAATRPFGLGILDTWVGLDIASVRYLGSTISPAFAVVIAYTGSRIVHNMNQDLVEARRMGSYQLESLLGRGGMGEVWLARHRFLARPAAVKLIRPENVALDPTQQRVMLTRFEREAQATASMGSPHTIQLYDFGLSEDGNFFYVMEMLHGHDLDALVTKFGPLSPARTIYLLLQICDSLGEAHDNGLIHRDVKPANIYVCHQGRELDFVKVLDFGLVKSMNDQRPDELQLTEAGGVRGTPNYIAPEQAMGEAVDGRSDIYALGCVAYWMLTGTYVFEGRTVMQTMMMHVTDAPKPPSSRTEQIIPTAMDDIVLSCLEKDPARRPRDVDGLADQLAACDVGPSWTQAQARAWWEEHRLVPSP